MRIIAWLLLFVGGCSLLTDAPPGVSEVYVEVDQSNYLAVQEADGPRPRYGFDLVARVRNESSHPIYLQRCRAGDATPVYGIELVEADDRHGASYNAVWACPGNDDPFVVGAGATRIDTLHLSGPNGWRNGSVRHYGTMEGRFRLRYAVGSCPSVRDCLLTEPHLRSDDFKVALSYPEEGDERITLRMVAGTWHWLHSLDEKSGHRLWPGTSGSPARGLEFDEEGGFRLYRADTIAAIGRIDVEREGLRRVIRYSVEAGHMEDLADAQFVWSERENTLLLEDAGSCEACLLHTFSRVDR